MRFAAAVLTALTIVPGAIWPGAALADPPPPPATPALAVGQEWSIRPPPATTAHVIIGHIDTLSDGVTAVSVSLIDVPGARGPMIIGHLPFERGALQASLDTLVATGQTPPPQFEPGYREWLADPEGGVFTVPVGDIIASLLTQMRNVGGP